MERPSTFTVRYETCWAIAGSFDSAITLRDRMSTATSPSGISLGENMSCPSMLGGHSFIITAGEFLVAVGSGLHFQDDFQFDRRTEWKARDTKDQARRDSLFAEDVSKQLRRRIGDLRVFGELRRCGDVH